jgi:hypothetical protein
MVIADSKRHQTADCAPVRSLAQVAAVAWREDFQPAARAASAADFMAAGSAGVVFTVAAGAGDIDSVSLP